MPGTVILRRMILTAVNYIVGVCIKRKDIKYDISSRKNNPYNFNLNCYVMYMFSFRKSSICGWNAISRSKSNY